MLYLYIYTSILVLDQINGTLTIYTNTTQYNASLLYQINALYLVHYIILILGRRGQQTYTGIDSLPQTQIYDRVSFCQIRVIKPVYAVQTYF